MVPVFGVKNLIQSENMVFGVAGRNEIGKENTD
jgi:hypothetical protein